MKTLGWGGAREGHISHIVLHVRVLCTAGHMTVSWSHDLQLVT